MEDNIDVVSKGLETGLVINKQGLWNPLWEKSKEKRRQVILSPFFFAGFLLDSAAILSM